MESFFKTSYKPLAVYVLLNLLCSGIAFADEFRIQDASGFINFAKAVNAGTSYSEYTVYLDADIEFDSTLSQQFAPIGNKDVSNHFNGVFDGQGHVIRNLTMVSSLKYVGLFGSSRGLAIKNVVIDDSCSFTSTFSTSSNGWNYIGGLISHCYSTSKSCVLKNIVSMASVTFKGSININSLCLGGLLDSCLPLLVTTLL